MSEGKPQQWFQARLRWGLLQERWGLYRWQEAESYFSQRGSPQAFQEALRIGHAAEHSLVAAPDHKHEPTIDCRFAEVVYLEELGIGRTAFQVYLGGKAAGEKMGFDHEFHPEAQVPPPMF